MNGEGSRLRRLTAPEAISDLGQPAEVVSLLERIQQRRETAARAQAMLDMTRYTFNLFRVSKRTFSEPQNDHVFSMLWGVKSIIDPEEPIDYLRVAEPIDLFHDPDARHSVGQVVHHNTIELIASTGETRPLIQHLGLLVQGLPNRYGIVS
jgi:hypothetical protein